MVAVVTLAGGGEGDPDVELSAAAGAGAVAGLETGGAWSLLSPGWAGSSSSSSLSSGDSLKSPSSWAISSAFIFMSCWRSSSDPEPGEPLTASVSCAGGGGRGGETSPRSVSLMEDMLASPPLSGGGGGGGGRGDAMGGGVYEGVSGPVTGGSGGV